MWNEQQNFAIVQTELDRVFYQNFDGEEFPGNATCETASVFKQDTIDRAAYIEEVFTGGGYFKQTAETANVQVTTPKVGYKLTTYVNDYTDSIFLSKDLFDRTKSPYYCQTIANLILVD